MKKVDIIRAWKDEEYRASLTDDERASLPEHPSGAIELYDAELGEVAGAMDSEGLATWGCCGTGWACTLWLCKATHYAASFGCCPETAA
ncbi:MAG TPA: mersacidin/lichenicidin family type 2 lantibiotic [Pyrinomonadaceae bacterium]|jgi:mersacidin/lichenicidin family type 2 lantibiotic|nr:mersacidin/lichenicidin family type 2 lantibiotic [Pyrinomonadaceae bacterium]